jgi:hypothetical protein
MAARSTLPSARVGLDHQASQFAEQAGDERLAAADPADDADDGFARVHGR